MRLHESGSASSTLSRSSSGSCTEPPVESCTTSEELERTAATHSRSSAWSSVGACAASRTWRWIIAAPAASHSAAVRAISSGVVGSCGQSALAVSAPVGATVISRASDMAASLHHACGHPAGPLRQRPGRRRGGRRDRRPGPPGLPRRHPRRRPGRDRLDGRKIWDLRLLRDEQSASDVGAPVLVVSQFTLYGDARKGRRPTWQAAAPGPVSEPLYDAVCAELERLGRPRRARPLRRGHAGGERQRRPDHPRPRHPDQPPLAG